MGPTILALGAPQPSIFSPPPSSWPKNAYKKGPMAFRETSAAISQKHETKTWSYRLEEGNSGGALPAWSPSSPSTSPPSPWWRGSSPPLDYGFVEVTYVSLLSLELHKWVPYELLNMITVIFVLPMWWIFLWVNICWDCKCLFQLWV
jgi:hypothetical protein